MKVNSEMKIVKIILNQNTEKVNKIPISNVKLSSQWVYSHILLYEIVAAASGVHTQYEIVNGEVTWVKSAFASIPSSCINGYEYSINGDVQGILTSNSIAIRRSLTDPSNCSGNILTIRPRVILNYTVLRDVILNGTTCITGKATLVDWLRLGILFPPADHIEMQYLSKYY